MTLIKNVLKNIISRFYFCFLYVKGNKNFYQFFHNLIQILREFGKTIKQLCQPLTFALGLTQQLLKLPKLFLVFWIRLCKYGKQFLYIFIYIYIYIHTYQKPHICSLAYCRSTVLTLPSKMHKSSTSIISELQGTENQIFIILASNFSVTMTYSNNTNEMFTILQRDFKIHNTYCIRCIESGT